MKKSKIFLATATLVLAVSALFATKANKKFVGITSAKTSQSGVNFIFKTAEGLDLLMTVGNPHNNQLYMNFNGGSQQYQLFTVVESTPHQLFFK